MPKNLFQFRIKNPAGEYYYYVLNEQVHTTADGNGPGVLLDGCVVDWDTLQLNWKRHSVYHGVFRKYSPDSVRFAGNAATILRVISNTLGRSEARATLEVMKLKSETQTYQIYGNFDIDFGKLYKSTLLYVDVALIEGGTSALLNAYDDNNFEIPLADPAGGTPGVEFVWLDGVMLQGSYHYETVPLADFQMFSPTYGGTAGIVYVTEDGPYQVATTNPVMRGINVPTGSFDEAWMLKALIGFTGTLKVEISLTAIEAMPPNTKKVKAQLWVNVYSASGWGAPVESTMLWEDPEGFLDAGTTSVTHTASSSDLHPDGWTHNYHEGDYVVLHFREVSEDGSDQDLRIQNSATPTPITLDFQYLQDPTEARAMRHITLFEKLVAFMTDNFASPPAQSDLLTTDVYPDDSVWGLNPYNTFFTCGDAIRRLYAAPDGGYMNPSIKTNFKDFAQNALVTLCAGIGIEKIGGIEKVVLEHLRHFYQKDVSIASLGDNISDFEVIKYLDYMGNSIKCGYPTETFDEVNGRFEYNQQAEYKTTSTRYQQAVDWTTKYKKSCYLTEYTRANLSNKKTTDAGSDNDVIGLQSNGNTIGYPTTTVVPYPYQLERAHTITAGLPADVADTVFNVPFSPKRNMLRMLPLLKSVYYGLPDPTLYYQTGNKNTSLSASLYTGSVVTERESIDLSDTSDMLFMPDVFRFKAEVPLDLNYLMDANPYGVMKFIVVKNKKRYQLEGFVLEAGVEPGTRNTFNFVLLCSPSTPTPKELG